MFDLHVLELAGQHNAVAYALSSWASPASERLHSTNIHAMAQDRHVVIQWKEYQKKLIGRECMQCAAKRRALQCHDTRAFSDPAHVHNINTKLQKVAEKVTETSAESVKENKYT